MGSYVCTQQDRHPIACYPLTMFLSRCLFLPHHDAGGRWLLQAPLPQCHPIQVQRPHLEVLGNVVHLVWVDSCGGVSNSIVLSLVRIFLFYFSVVPPLHPFCPACIDCGQVPLPSCFPSPPSPLWQCHYCIALALPMPVWRHAIIPSLLPCQHHLCIHTTATTIAIPLPPCHSCQHTSLALDAS